MDKKELLKEMQAANAGIKTTDVKGKQYAEVSERILAFRKVFPTGFIQTDIVTHENGFVLMKASAGYIDGEQVITLGTGMAYEKEGTSYINKTSYIENCETSAVGRALGMAGFGVDGSVASAHEVRNAQAQQSSKKPQVKAENEPIEDSQLEAILEEYAGDRLEALINHFGVRSAKDLTKQQAQAIIYNIKQKKAGN